MTVEAPAKGAFVRILREYADRANNNYSQRVAVPEFILRDAAAAIEDQRAELDRLADVELRPWVELTSAITAAHDLGTHHDLGHNAPRWQECPQELCRSVRAALLDEPPR